MHADAKDDSDNSSFAASPSESDNETQFTRPMHNIMDVLRPARPPEPRNFRVVRLFDIEAAQSDPTPVAAGEPTVADTAAQFLPVAPGPTKPAKEHLDPDSRAAVRAARRKSLFASAGGMRY